MPFVGYGPKAERVRRPFASPLEAFGGAASPRNFLLKSSVSKTTFPRFFQGFSEIRITQEIPMRRPGMNRIMGAHPGTCTGMHS